ncbi:hypothetical protein C7H19_03105 [Aphanothece hegewaldii CCALA 016]|uniref:Uncharacterized protein n=1 Tax=Aphanothece hegewaldii CCALA 016 TaxID=2107694 RepID=A0A2T1M2T9_9CHRO|nr:hypothetical protein [Aphanothece hegewaldii]PSF39055.1 hypothetical protein C7H19_03105 [Aphanothece hegewaldii CCALA 016]
MKKSTTTSFWLSLATSPFLLAYLGLRSVSEWLTEAGKNSEEVFRGDRLPVLNFPSKEDQTSSES